MKKSLQLLFLAGGLSTRMGEDKGLLYFENQPLFKQLVERLSILNLSVFISIQEQQYKEYSSLLNASFIKDVFSLGGPLNGIFSYHTLHPKHAVLVIPCDMYLLNSLTVEKLIQLFEMDGENSEAIYAFSIEGNFEPFPCILSSEALSKCLNLFQYNQLEKYSMKYIASILQKKIIPLTDNSQLINFNTIESVQQFYKSQNQG
jgi:molybdopterin-guanine dinucleotide biosynthesis protein A